MAKKRERTKRNKKIDSVDFLHSGGTLFNLAASQRGRLGGVPRGRVINLVGDGSSGKTIRALEICAYALFKLRPSKIFPDTKRMKIKYNNPEGVMDFDLEAMYGPDFKNSVEWLHIRSVEKTGFDFIKACRAKKKDEGLIYIIDSLDALKPDSEQGIFDESIKKDALESTGYGMAKPKFMHTFFTQVIPEMKDKDITLIIISQTKKNIGSTFAEKYRTGGDALNFYTHLVPWFNEQGKMKKTVKGKEVVYGVRSKTKVKRSKVSKPYRECSEIILFDHGIDDICSMLEFLVNQKEEYGKEDIKTLKDIFGELEELVEIEEKAKEKGRSPKIKRVDMVDMIEKNNLEDVLIQKTEDLWFEIEDAVKPKRKKRF